MTKASFVRHLVTFAALFALLTLAARDPKSGWGLMIAFLAYTLGKIHEGWRQGWRK